MIKAVEWLLGISIILALWISRLLQLVPYPSGFFFDIVLYFLPLHAVVIFALISAVIITYRTCTFNDCPQASVELLKEIKEAKTDLKRRGFVFPEWIKTLIAAVIYILACMTFLPYEILWQTTFCSEGISILCLDCNFGINFPGVWWPAYNVLHFWLLLHHIGYLKMKNFWSVNMV